MNFKKKNIEGIIKGDHSLKKERKTIKGMNNGMLLYLDIERSDIRNNFKMRGSIKKKENIKSQDMRTISQKPIPLHSKNRVENESRSKIQQRNQILEGRDLINKDIDDYFLQEPQKQKLMMWLVPQMKNSSLNAKAKKTLQQALKNKIISKEDLINMMLKKNGKKINNLLPHSKDTSLRYASDNDRNDSYKDKIDKCNIF